MQDGSRPLSLDLPSASLCCDRTVDQLMYSLQVAAMSTLLDIKSSVLRQVQVCPSFRRKTEQEPEVTNSQEPPTGAWWVPRANPAGHVDLASFP
jgi:hypothetical protein